MDLKEFAKRLDNREYGYQIFTKEEIEIAKENDIVIITGASDDLMEIEGAICDEADCFDGGIVRISPTWGVLSRNYWNKNQIPIRAKWCEEKDEKGNTIPWTYELSIPHETFMIYEEGKPYCRGVVFSIKDLREDD